MVYSTGRFKALVPVLVLLFFACGLFYETICFSFAWCNLALVFFSHSSIGIASIGEERANISAFRTFVRFALVWFCLFPLSLSVWEELWLVVVALPGLFSSFVTVIVLQMFASDLCSFHCQGKTVLRDCVTIWVSSHIFCYCLLCSSSPSVPVEDCSSRLWHQRVSLMIFLVSVPWEDCAL